MPLRAQRIAPRFQEMRGGEIPATKRRSFVFVIAEPDYIWNLFLQLGPIEPALCQIVGNPARGVKHGIRAEDEKLFDPTGRDVSRELENAVIARIPLALAQQNCAPDIFQRGI